MALRPYIFIRVLKFNSYEDFTKSRETLEYKYTIKPKSFTCNETRDGVNGTIVTKGDRYFIKPGDKMEIELGYEYETKSINDVFSTYLPVLVVTSININADFDIEINFIDEFSYLCQLLTFIPVKRTTEQQLLISKYFGYFENDVDKPSGFAKEEVDLDILLGYIQSLLIPNMYYTIGQDNTTILYTIGQVSPSIVSIFYKYKDNIVTGLGKWKIDSIIKISEVIKKLKDIYFVNLYSVSSSYDNNVQENEPLYPGGMVMVEELGSIVSPGENNTIKLVDNINIISDDLKWIDPSNDIKVVRGTFSQKVINGKKTEVQTDIWYAYYDEKGQIVCSNDKNTLINLDRYTFEEFKINSGSEQITPERRKQLTSQKLLANEYLGWGGGSINTFFQKSNIMDCVSLKFLNSARLHSEEDSSLESKYDRNGVYGISSIIRTFDNGLFMDIKLRQKL